MRAERATSPALGACFHRSRGLKAGLLAPWFPCYAIPGGSKATPSANAKLRRLQFCPDSPHEDSPATRRPEPDGGQWPVWPGDAKATHATAKMWTQPASLIRERVSEMRGLRAVEHERNGIPAHATWTALENIMLTAGSQTQEDKC